MLGFDALASAALANHRLLSVSPFTPDTPYSGGGATAGGGHQDDRRRVERATRRREYALSAEMQALIDERYEDAQRSDAAARLGRLGGLKGGPARAESLTDRQRTQAARHAAHKRWK